MIKDYIEINNKKIKGEHRTIKDLEKVLFEKPGQEEEQKIIYTIFRNVKKRAKIRYDLTLFYNNTIGNEYARTHGHTHPKKNGIGYAEIYEVLKGKIEIILQYKEKGKTHICSVIAKKNEKIIIPPNCGHMAICLSKGAMMSNLVYEFETNYSEYKKKGPACFKLTNDMYIFNENYHIASFCRKKAEEFNQGFKIYKDIKDTSLIELINQNKKIRFLKEPFLFE